MALVKGTAHMQQSALLVSRHTRVQFAWFSPFEYNHPTSNMLPPKWKDRKYSSGAPPRMLKCIHISSLLSTSFEIGCHSHVHHECWSIMNKRRLSLRWRQQRWPPTSPQELSIFLTQFLAVIASRLPSIVPVRACCEKLCVPFLSAITRVHTHREHVHV